MNVAGASAMQRGLMRCEVCSLVSRPPPGAHEGHCPRCGSHVEFRKAHSIQRTWALLAAATICYIPANLLPIMTTHTASGSESGTILEGVAHLWSPTGWPLAIIVLVASIVIPSAKILALVWLLVSVQRRSTLHSGQRVRMYRVVKFIGRWSMVDVFVVTFTAALIQLGPLMSVLPAIGIIFFAAVVVFTMLAAETFDSRLIWDPESHGAISRGNGHG